MSLIALLLLNHQAPSVGDSQAIVAAVRQGARDWYGTRPKPFALFLRKGAVPTVTFDLARRTLNGQGMLSVPSKATFSIAVRALNQTGQAQRSVTLDIRGGGGGGCQTRYFVELKGGAWSLSRVENIRAY